MIHKENPYKGIADKLTIDCSQCSGLCCVSLYFAKSEGFPKDKPAGEPCDNLGKDFRCMIHPQLARCNLKGCLAYDCFGAGQKVTSGIYGGKDWAGMAGQMFKVFLIICQLHQMLWFLLEASTIIPAEGLAKEIDELIAENMDMTQQSPEDILTLDTAEYRMRVNQILRRTGALVGGSIHKSTAGRKVMDYVGKNFKKAVLDGKDFSIALLIAANLEGCSLYGANFLGADLRDTNIRNTDLRDSIFLAQGQINAAKGNDGTKLPPGLVYPSTWERGL